MRADASAADVTLLLLSLLLHLTSTAGQHGDQSSNTCTAGDEFFGDCARGGANGGRWTTPEKCERYSPLFGSDSRYDSADPDCPWLQGDGASKACQYYCYYNEEFGVARINHALWESARRAEAKQWKGWKRSSSDRADEVRLGLRNFWTMKLPLGRVLEIGSGPFTQTATLIDVLRKRYEDPGVASIDLVDPNIGAYNTTTPSCTYKDGSLRGYPVTMHATSGERMDFPPETFDTVISINVLDHCEDAFEYMRRLHRVLKPGGQLIFHDRVYDHFWSVFDPVKDAHELSVRRPLRIKRRLMEVFLKHYTVYLFSVQLTPQMLKRMKKAIMEEPMWVVALKTAPTAGREAARSPRDAGEGEAVTNYVPFVRIDSTRAGSKGSST